MNQKPKNKLTKQQRLVLGWLRAGERVTQVGAYGRGVERLGARIWDLKKRGYRIADRMVKVKKGSTGRWAAVKEYWIEPEDRLQLNEINKPAAGGTEQVKKNKCKPLRSTGSTPAGRAADGTEERAGPSAGDAAATAEGRMPPATLFDDVDEPYGYG